MHHKAEQERIQKDLSESLWLILGARWDNSLRAKNLSPTTKRCYKFTVSRWIEWLGREGLDLDPEDVEAHHVDSFIARIVDTTSAANAAHHYRNLRVFFNWLARRGEVPRSPMDQTEPPIVPDKITPLLSDEEHHAVLVTCSSKTFMDRRDMAIILLLIDTELRVSELAALQLEDIDIARRQLLIHGKGRKVRIVGLGNSAGLALARYVRLRRQHRAHDLPDLWVSTQRRRAFSVNGISRMLA